DDLVARWRFQLEGRVPQPRQLDALQIHSALLEKTAILVSTGLNPQTTALWVQSETMASTKLLYSAEEVSRRISELAAAISREFAGESVILVGVLKGAAIFLADLARALTIDATFDFISVGSYQGKHSTGEVRLNKDLDESIEGRNVLLVEDILDTGLTMNYL